MNLTLAFLSGLVAAFTPCVIILIPALLYSFIPQNKSPIETGRDSNKDGDSKFVVRGVSHRKKHFKRSFSGFLSFFWKRIIIKNAPVFAFVLSFIATYSLFALFLKTILSSSIKYGLQMGIGILFVVLGVMALMGKFNPVSFPLIKNKFLFGALFAVIISINPCTFAYLGVLLGTTKTTSLFLTMIFFSFGLLTPAILFMIFGRKLLFEVKKFGKITHAMDIGMNVLLIGIGAYLMFTIKSFGVLDVYISGALLVLTFIILLRSFYFLRGWNELKSPINTLLFVSLVIISLAILIHCHSGVQNNQENYISPFSNKTIVSSGSSGETCSGNVETCSVCRRCMFIFSVGAGGGFLAIFGAEILRRRRLRKEQSIEKNKIIDNK